MYKLTKKIYSNITGNKVEVIKDKDFYKNDQVLFEEG